VNRSRQAPEDAEIRAQEEVRTQDEEAREDQASGEDRIKEALETAAEVAERTGGLGTPGRPVNRRSPFMIGLTAAFGVAVAYGLIELVLKSRSVLILIFLAFFIAAGLDPIVGWLVRHRVPRWAAVLIVVGGGLAVVAGFLAAAIPPLAGEATSLAHQIPHYVHDLQNRNSQLGKLNVKYHVQDRLTKLLTSGSGSLIGGVIGAGALVIGTVSEILAIAVLSIYFLIGLPQIKLFFYRMVPHTRRPRAILIGDEIFAKVGGYMLGSFITAVIAGFGTYIWLLAWGVPYPLLLGTFVALLDLIPVIGSTVGGIVVSLVALTVSLPVALATLGFYGGTARSGQPDRGADRRGAARYRRRAGGHPGRGGHPAPAERGRVPAPGQELILPAKYIFQILKVRIWDGMVQDLGGAFQD
jgi:predicted PurR-regulated permease PerM